MQPLKVFVGFDHRQHVAFHALENSIFSRASVPITFCPLVLPHLPITRVGLTAFTYSRFLVPYLCDYEGFALFLDSDQIVQADVKELFDIAEADPSKAVWTIDYQDPNLNFEKAGVMMFNNDHPDNKILTPEFIEGTDVGLHQIRWTQNIGVIPEEWGHLVMYMPPKAAKLIHYTAGIPIWPETEILGYKDEWHQEAQRMMSSVSWYDLMARSVHAQPVLKIFQEHKRQQDAQTLAKAAMEQAKTAAEPVLALVE